MTRGIRRLSRDVAVATLVCVAAIGGSLVSSSMAGAASGPKSGGTITIGGTPGYPQYWVSTGYTAVGAGITTSMLAMGALFLPPFRSGQPYVPDLALGYSYNRAGTVLTIDLRHGEKFTDGTAFNAQAVAWNWSSAIDGLSTSATAVYLAPVASVSTKGAYTVVVHFTSADTAFVPALALTNTGQMESPTAYNTEGISAINALPVGAGPFKMTVDTPAQNITLTKNPGYWDSKHVYLGEINFISTGTDALSNYNDLLSGAVSVEGIAATASPSILAEALANKSYNLNVGPFNATTFLPLNSQAPPFNNQLAREAIDYCTDRSTLASSTLAGFVEPAYIYSFLSMPYFPSAGGKTSNAAAEKLLPYQYNPTMATSIVYQLGGLSFTLKTTAGSLIPTALQQMWTTCGIHASIVTVPALAQELVDLGAGTYQAYVGSLGTNNPNLGQYFIPQGARFNLQNEVDDPVIQALWEDSLRQSKSTQLQSDWQTIWKDLAKDALLIPIVQSPTYYFFDKCVHNIEFNLPSNYLHTWSTC